MIHSAKTKKLEFAYIHKMAAVAITKCQIYFHETKNKLFYGIQIFPSFLLQFFKGF